MIKFCTPKIISKFILTNMNDFNDILPDDNKTVNFGEPIIEVRR